MSCVTCLKCLLIFVNVLFGIIGLLLLAVGIFLLVGLNKILNENMQDIIKGIIKLGDSSTANGTDVNLDITVIAQPVGIALIVIGAVIAILAFTGAFGACCNSKALLLIYLLVLITLIVAQIVVIALFFTGQFDTKIRKAAKATIRDHYVGIDDYGVYSLTWNFVMVDRKCCGVDSYKDFDDAKHWQRQRNVTVGVTVNLTTPIACCKLSGKFPNVEMLNEACAMQPTDATSNWKTGCWGEVTSFLSKYRHWAILTVSLILLVQVIIALLAIGIACSIKNKVSDYQ